MFRYDPSLNRRRESSVSGITLGVASSGSQVNVPESTFSAHTLITGKTGSGKTSLLYSIINGLVRSKANVVLIDPHGSLTETVISNLELDNLYYLSSESFKIDDSDYSIRLNPVSLAGGSEVSVVTGVLRDLLAMDEEFSQGTWGPRLQILVGNLLTRLALEGKIKSLRDFVALLMDRKKLIETMEQLTVRELGIFIERTSVNQKNWMEYASSTLNKLVALLSDNSISNLVADEDTFSITNFIHGNGNFLAGDFSKGKASRSSIRVASSLLLAKIWALLLQNPTERLFIVIDEVQELSENLLYTMLNEGRKFGVSLIMATQSLSFFSDKTRVALLSNADNFFCFQQSHEDSVYFGNMFPRTLTHRIVNTLVSQMNYSVTRIDRKSVITSPMTFKTMHMDSSDPQKLRPRVLDSVKKYGKGIRPPEVYISKGINTHSLLQERFGIFFKNLGLSELPIQEFNGSRPDQIIADGSQIFICEVEISDMLRKDRIRKKLQSYGGMKIIFITENGDGSLLYEKILDFIRNDEYLSDLENITILERRNTRFYILGTNTLKLPKIDDFYAGSYLISLKPAKRQFASYILSYLREHRFFRVEKNQLPCPDYLNGKLFKKYLEEEFETMVDPVSIVSGK